MNRVRVSLRGLLVVVTACAAFFGYAVVRKQRLGETAAALKRQGVSVLSGKEHFKPVGFWPSGPDSMMLSLVADGPDRLRISGEPYSIDAAKAYCGEVERVARAIGVENVTYYVSHCVFCGGYDKLHTLTEFERYRDDGKY